MDTEIPGIVTVNKHFKNFPAPNFLGAGGVENLAIIFDWPEVSFFPGYEPDNKGVLI